MLIIYIDYKRREVENLASLKMIFSALLTHWRLAFD